MACWCDGKCPYLDDIKKLAGEGKSRRVSLQYRHVLMKAPLCVEANLAVATALWRGGNQPDAALVHIERAAESGGETARTHFERGSALRAQGRVDEAASEFYKAMEIDPNSPAVAVNLVSALEMGGHVKQAAEVIGEARKSFPEDRMVRRKAANIVALKKDYKKAIVILAGDDLDPTEFLDRGRYFEKSGEFGAAWDDWMKGKALLAARGHKYNAKRFETIFSALAEASAPPKPSFIPKAAPFEGIHPLFVTGFPRSGTTMMENALSQHSAIVAGDEMPALHAVTDAMPAWLKVRPAYPNAMMALALGENSIMPNMLRDLYLAIALERIKLTHRKKIAAPKFFTDKMPMNEMHLPLIGLLFPGTPVVYMRRHPLDVMLSCMSQWLVHGGFYAADLESCARHYLAVDQLVQVYLKNLYGAGGEQPLWGMPKLIVVRYERFVEAPEEGMKEILGAIGLSYQKQCLHPHKNPRFARTLSYQQVREPINRNSVGRWKNFREQLKPAAEILAPILERESYERI